MRGLFVSIYTNQSFWANVWEQKVWDGRWERDDKYETINIAEAKNNMNTH